ncbi:hypothetical protein SAZ11_62175 [Streptomyces sp. FXJ1.4098]|nr:hypothetical protein [Streptomyces sp. FXJ1.4098]
MRTSAGTAKSRSCSSERSSPSVAGAGNRWKVRGACSFNHVSIRAQATRVCSPRI